MKHILFTYISVVVFIIGCNPKTENAHSHESTDEHSVHAHEELVSNQTLFSDNYELFVEYNLLVINKTTRFTTHITRLNDYKPISEGKLTISLLQGDQGIRQSFEEPEVPGIFIPSLQPKKEGKCRLVFEFINKEGIKTIFEVSENVYSDLKVAERHSSTSDNINSISLLKEQAWESEFAIQKLTKKTFREVISTSGQIITANGDQTSVVAPFSGIVRIKETLLPGKRVYKGQKLLEITGKGLASGNILVQYTQIKTNYEKAKANFERSAILVKDKIISQKDFLDAKTEFEQTRVAFENTTVTDKGNISTIFSTETGYIKELNVSDGQYIETGSPLAVIVKNQKLVICAEVSQNHWHCLPDISEANFITPYDGKLHNTSDLNGRLISYSRNATNSAWSTPVYFEINNTDNLIPGAYIEVYLLSTPIPNVIVIPMSSLIEEQGNFYVFVQQSGELYEKRQIKTGVNNGKEIEVLFGLKQGEVIVVKGAYQVKLASLSSALPAHGHEH